MNITIGYLNIEGLSPPKHQACCSLIDAGIFDILILSETWFPKTFNYMSHPYSFVQSKFVFKEVNSRQSGGLLVLCSIQARSYISSFQISVHGILLDVSGISILSVYLPPSMSFDQIHTSLNIFQNYHILLGDINVRFQGISKRPSMPSLQELWRSWLSSHSFSMSDPIVDVFTITQHHSDIFTQSHSDLLSKQFLPTVGNQFRLFANCELDHVFHSNTISHTLRLLGSAQFNLKTVHQYFIHVTLDLSFPEQELRQGLGRFHLEYLEKPGISAYLAQTWTELDSQLNWNITDVDVYDSIISNSVQAVAEQVLGIYDVLSRRKSPDNVQPLLNSQLSALAAIRLFKRKQRNLNPSLLIQSHNSSPMQECIAKFHSTFFTDDVQVFLPPLNSTEDLPLHQFITSSKILNFLKKYPKDKACGLDSIHTVLLQALSTTQLFSRLSGLYQLCIQTGQTPQRWNTSVMYLLPKKSEPPITCDSVRPLSILPMFRRIFESLLLPLFTNPEYIFTRLHPAQAGFRKGYSTLTQAAICHHALSTKSIQLAVFLDFKSAYDVTTPKHVMTVLQRRGMPVRLQYIIYSLMFKYGAFQLVVNGELSQPIDRNCGLPQGAPLSPIIFDMFVDSLVHQLNQKPFDILPSCLFFADDGVLLARSIQHARNMLKIAEEWAKQNGMIYNVSKCGIIFTTSPTVGDLVLFNNIIPIISTYKYLGFPVISDGIDFTTHIQSQCQSTTAFLKFVQVQCSEWTPYTRYIIYNTFIRPKLEYGAPLTYAYNNTELFESLQNVQDAAFAWIFNTNMKRPKVLQGILGALSIEQRFSHLRCSFQLHLDHSDNDNPLRKLIQISNMRQYIYSLRSNRLYSDFLSIPELPPSYSLLKLKMADFLLSRRSGIISKSTSILVNYIPISARTDSLIDKVFKSPIQFQRRLLTWRRGTLFFGMKCICGESWTRRHITCLPTIILTPELDSKFNQCLKEQSKNFSKLDFLLKLSMFLILGKQFYPKKNEIFI